MGRQEDAIIGQRLKTSYVTTVASITLVLFVLGFIGLVVLHARILSDHVKENIGVSLILYNNTQPGQAAALQRELEVVPAVKSTDFVSGEEAAEMLMTELGEDFVSFLGYNPLFPSIEIRLHADYANPVSIQSFTDEVLKNPLVMEVHYQEDLVVLINQNVRRISIAMIVFCGLLLLIAIALINNTIRLSVFSKRFLIKSMQLVGATQAFIRKPFVMKGILQGVIGSVLAGISLWGVLFAAQRHIPELAVVNDFRLLFALFGLILFAGIIICWLSTFFAVKKYLRIKTDSLYLY
ncbi:MAG TPA: permease-like cell division protein FtsX [Bacteroidales bacterium]|nr:permease-like cell division protein FtsX [Bacteroidales bacterium]